METATTQSKHTDAFMPSSILNLCCIVCVYMNFDKSTESLSTRMNKPQHKNASDTNKANQLNPNSSAHKSGVDNKANQLNPNNKAAKGTGK